MAGQLQQMLNKSDIDALKAYVKGPSSQNQSASTVLLSCSHSNLQATFMELRFDLHTTVRGVKERLQTHCGTSPDMMRLSLLDARGQKVCELADDSRMLGYFSPVDGMRIHILDLDPHSASAGGWLEDLSKVDKYEISEEAYEAREKSFRKYKQEKLAADPTWTLQKEMAQRRGEAYTPPPPQDPDKFTEEAASISVGQRCEVSPGGKRGEVTFVGRVEGLPLGFWVGVRYDEPVGKNDGSVKGQRLFTCEPGYGAFVRPDKLEVGDFPERDPFEEEEEEDEI